MASKLVTHWISGVGGIVLSVEIPKRRNGLHNEAMLGRVLQALSDLPPADAFDPIEPVPEIVARAAQRDGIVPEYVEITGSHPPVPVFEDDEIPGPRCAPNGACYGD